MLQSVTFYESTFYPEGVHFNDVFLNFNKIKVVLCFCNVICKFLLICFKVRMSKISDKSDKFLLNYSNFYESTCFRTQCIYATFAAISRRLHMLVNTLLSILLMLTQHRAFSGHT